MYIFIANKAGENIKMNIYQNDSAYSIAMRYFKRMRMQKPSKEII